MRAQLFSLNTYSDPVLDIQNAAQDRATDKSSMKATETRASASDGRRGMERPHVVDLLDRFYRFTHFAKPGFICGIGRLGR